MSSRLSRREPAKAARASTGRARAFFSSSETSCVIVLFYLCSGSIRQLNSAGKATADPRRPAIQAKSQHLLHRTDALAQPRLVARGGIPMQSALLNRLVERGHRLAVGLLGCF